jgi:hypothetical protein
VGGEKNHAFRADGMLDGWEQAALLSRRESALVLKTYKDLEGGRKNRGEVWLLG